MTFLAAPYEDRSRRRRSECGERAGTARGGECVDQIKPDRGIAKFQNILLAAVPHFQWVVFKKLPTASLIMLPAYVRNWLVERFLHH